MRRLEIDPPNPSGICQCGCGKPAPLATQSNTKLGHVKDKPLRFIRGHVGYLKRRETLTSDLWRVEDRGFETPCWICVLAPQHKRGYCKVWLRGKPVSAHRAMYEQEVGPIPPGMTIDHLCRQPRCINPSHLEAVTTAENNHRGASAKLTWDLVHAIRAAEGPERAIAAAFGMSYQQIHNIRLGRAWRE